MILSCYGSLPDKTKTSLTSGCSPSPWPSPHSSARHVPAEPRVMLFATGVVKAKSLYCNGLAIYKIVELRPRKEERSKQ